MRKETIIVLIFLFVISFQSMACDICGCGVGSYYIGILPEYNKRFLGLRYQYKSLQTHLGPFGNRTPITADERYQSLELWGGWNIGKRFRLLAFVPYNFNERKSQSSSGSKTGLGDIALMGYYNLLNHTGQLGEKLLVQSLWVGAGVKAPTGQYEPSERLAVQESPNNFQLGTASTDFTFNVAYDVRYNDLGINLNANYKMNTANKFDYRYGNKVTTNALAYYKFRIANVVTIAPNLGVLYETAEKDQESNYTVEVSGGFSTSIIAGMELATKGFSMGFNYQHVAAQRLAGGRAFAGDRMMMHMSIPF